MPRFSASSMAAALTFSWLISASHSCSKSTRRASATRHLAARGVLRHDLLEHPLQVDVDLLHAHAGEHHGHGLLLDRHFDLALIQFAGGEHRPHLLAASARGVRASRGLSARRVVADRRRGQQVEQALFDAARGPPLRRSCAFAFAHQADGIFDQLADHALDVAAVIADLGVLRGLDLDERGPGELGQAGGRFRSCRRRSGRS